MTAHEDLRLLPWSGPDDKPCYLSADNASSRLSRLADAIESVELGVAAKLTEYASEVLADEEADLEELRLLATGLAHSLSKTLTVAHSRGHRLPPPDLPPCPSWAEGVGPSEPPPS
ncbi:hypothetical protein [Streptomyces sp. NRRL S-87]|uniref:hypothetical protein n=1 Tax=Streptomyces sp. NRRL S-87 TaxID=1463920 RepID=UPI0004BECAE0|nr:hypothetical protein [Streptomyces sp. NRRL S-87]